MAVLYPCDLRSKSHSCAVLCAEEGDAAVGSVKAKAEVLLRSRHAAERMLRCWGSGAGLVFEDTRDAIKKLLSVRSAT